MVILEKDLIKFKQFSAILLIFFACCLHANALADVNKDAFDSSIIFLSAQNANTIGLFAVAETCYLSVLQSNDSTNDDKIKAQNAIIDLYIMRGDWQKADKFLKSNVIDDSVDTCFRVAFVLFMKNNFRECEKLISSFDEKDLNKNDVPLYYTLRGMMSLRMLNIDMANKYFSMSEYACLNNKQRMEIKIFALREMLRFDSSLNSNLAIAQNIEKIVQQNGIDIVPDSMVKELVVAYVRINENEKAKKLLEQKLLSLPENKSQSRLSFNLFFALAYGLDSEKGSYYIYELLIKSSDDFQKTFAINFLIEKAKTNEAKIGLIEFFDQILTYGNQSNSFLKQVMLSKVKLAMDIGDTILAQKITENLVTKFPADSNKEEMLKLLAYLSWLKEPKEYRMMADYFDQLKDCINDPREKALYGEKVADCYFLNGDYAIAANLYSELFNNAFVNKSVLLSKQISIDIAIDDLDLAEKHLIDFDVKFKTSSDERWQAEFNIIKEFLIKKLYSRAEIALDKIVNNKNKQISPLLRVKFYLMHAEMMFENRKFDIVVKTAQNIQDIFAKQGQSKDIASVVAHAIYLQFKSEIELLNLASAQKCLKNLRDEYFDSIYTKISYFDEANYLSQHDQCENALNVLNKFVDLYAEQELTKHAKFQIACCLKNIGFAKYDDAIKEFENIINKYPNDQIAYQARIEQANIMRLQGRFGSAQLIYEYLLNEYPTDNRSNFTKFYLAKCLIAQHNKNKMFLENGLVKLEKLYLSKTIEEKLNLEVAIEYCFALKMANNFELLQKICIETLTRHFFKNDFKDYSANEIFWLNQLLFLLKQSAKITDNNTDEEGIRKLIESVENLKY